MDFYIPVVHSKKIFTVVIRCLVTARCLFTTRFMQKCVQAGLADFDGRQAEGGATDALTPCASTKAVSSRACAHAAIIQCSKIAIDVVGGAIGDVDNDAEEFDESNLPGLRP